MTVRTNYMYYRQEVMLTVINCSFVFSQFVNADVFVEVFTQP